MTTPSEAALHTLGQLARLGKVEVWTHASMVCIRYEGQWRGERVQLQAVEATLAEAILVIGRQAAGRQATTDKKGCLPGPKAKNEGVGGGVRLAEGPKEDSPL